MTRVFDILIALICLIVLLPFLLLISVWIRLDAAGPVLYKQLRVGRFNKDFYLLKFRSMKTDAENEGSITVGDRDPRITRSGYYLRKYKLDELPQLYNVLTGEMSIVGPRPELRKYVEMYTTDQQQILQVRPGITDLASIEYINENLILSSAPDPEALYIHKIMPDKIRLNQYYIRNRNLIHYFTIIFRTIGVLFR